MTRLAWFFLWSVAVTSSVHADADWKMDAAASTLGFAATFEKAPAPGVFREFDVRLRFDPEHPAAGVLEVFINIASADMASAEVNKAIAGPEWFDFARFPKASFSSNGIQRDAGGRYVARGLLTLKGMRQPVEVPFTWNAAANGSASMEGEFAVKRAAFAIGTGEWAAPSPVGPDVKVKFRVKLRKR